MPISETTSRLNELHSLLLRSGSSAIKSKFPLLPFDEIVPSTDREYLIDGILPRGGLAVMWGEPKCGKSFLSLDFSLHVALGWEYRGRAVTQGTVVYCAFEGGNGVKKRVEGFRRSHLTEYDQHVPFYLLSARVNLVADRPELVASIRAQLTAAPDAMPALVVLDTLNRSIEGSESKDEDMSAYVAAADAIREEFGCAVLIIHHCGVVQTRPRGHTGLPAAADVQLAVRLDGEFIRVKVEFMRDGEAGAELVSKLQPVQVGVDELGNLMTSCIVVEADGANARAAQPSGRRHSPKQQLALAILRDILRDAAEPVSVKRWEQELLGRRLLNSKNPRTDFKRLVKALQDRGNIAVADDHVRLT